MPELRFRKNLLLGTVNVWVSTDGAFCDSFRKGPRTSSMKACSLPYQSLIVASTSFRSLSLATVASRYYTNDNQQIGVDSSYASSWWTRGSIWISQKKMVFLISQTNPSGNFISRDSFEEQLQDSSLQSTLLRSKCSRSERSCSFSAMSLLFAWRTKKIGERTTMLAALPNGMLNPVESQRSRDTTLLPRISKKTCVDPIDQGCPVVGSPVFCCLTLYFAVAKPRYVIKRDLTNLTV